MEKGALFFYSNSNNLETTSTLRLDQNRLQYTNFTETFNIPVAHLFVMALFL